MRRAETTITLSEIEREQLEAVVRTRTAAQREVQRARLVLLAADGMANTAIAQEVGLSRSRVVTWRQRFGRERLAGLRDEARPGKPRRYGKETEQRSLALLDTEPPGGVCELERTFGCEGPGGCLGGPGLAGPADPWDPTPAASELVSEHGPTVCTQGRRYRGLVPGPAGERCGAERG